MTELPEEPGPDDEPVAPELAPEPPPVKTAAEALDRFTALADDLAAVLALARDGLAATGAPYHVVVIPDAGAVIDHVCATAAEAAAFLQPYDGQDVRVRVFQGQRCPTTRRPVFLITPEGKFPVFVSSLDDAIDEGGSLAALPALPVPPPAAVGPDDNAHEDEDEDDHEEDPLDPLDDEDEEDSDDEV